MPIAMAIAVTIITMISSKIIIAMKPQITTLIPTVVTTAPPTCRQSTTNIQRPQAKLGINSNRPVCQVTVTIPTPTFIIIKLALIRTMSLPNPKISRKDPLIIPLSPSVSPKPN